MYSKFQLALKWLQYFIRASNGRGHGIHSPFVYALVREVFNDSRSYYAYEKIEGAKDNLLVDHRMLQLTDLGAAPSSVKDGSRKVSSVAAKSVSDQKFGRLLFRLANFYRAHSIIELGTSLGISTSYLASADSRSRVTTMEGSPAVTAIAEETFLKLGLKNITSVTGNFDETLSTVLASGSPADLVFIDGNHRKKPVLDYFEKFINNMSTESLIIIHDIHWSSEMEEAWEQIRQHPQVKMSIDIFSAGLVFFRREFKVKQHFLIRF
jgi:predicted O-methyltransferase YrrM